jgi:diguanylate cyclase
MTPGGTDKKLFDQIGRFLAEHALRPTPENYALVYGVLANSGSPVSKAVQSATSDGIRLSQRDADRIMSEHGLVPSDRIEFPDMAAIQVARQHLEDFDLIVETTRAETELYGRDLEKGAQELQAAGGSMASLVRLTSAMIGRTRNAESQLQAAREEASRLRQKLAEAEEEARCDALTQLPNRRAFEDRLEELKDNNIRVSIGLCDIDRFKLINDNHGHGVGDRVLRMVGQVLEGACGRHMVARIGGEEFAVLFEDVLPEEAAKTLNEARELLVEKNFRVRETDAPLGRISFSAGLACGFLHNGSDPLLKRADALLYEAKNGGRNQVRFEPKVMGFKRAASRAA